MRELGDINFFISIAELEGKNKKKLDEEKKKAILQPVIQIATKPKGRPPILLDLDEKLIKFLKAVRAKGGVVNIHIV